MVMLCSPAATSAGLDCSTIRFRSPSTIKEPLEKIRFSSGEKVSVSLSNSKRPNSTAETLNGERVERRRDVECDSE